MKIINNNYLDYQNNKQIIKEQNNFAKLSNSSENMENQENLEDISTDEMRKLVGYIMPILEAEKVSPQSKSNIKSILWNYKESFNKKLQEKLIKKNNDNSSNQ
jgi:DNA-directed RNA polymerase subunit F